MSTLTHGTRRGRITFQVSDRGEQGREACHDPQEQQALGRHSACAAQSASAVDAAVGFMDAYADVFEELAR